MFKYILPLFFTSFLFSNNLSTENHIVSINEPFIIKDKSSSFDNSLTYTHKTLLSCSPELNAVYKIESASKLKVIPKTALQSSTTYSCSYNKNNFSFQTEAFQILNADYFEREKILRLNFNDKLNTKSIQSAISVTKQHKLSKTKLNYSIIHSDGNNIVLKINEKIGQDTINLTINKKLKTKEGKFLKTNYKNRFNNATEKITLDSNKKAMTIIDNPQMVALDNGEFALRIFVNDNLTGKSKNTIQIDGIENFEVHDYEYMDYQIRKKYNIKDSYYFHDITSKEFKPNKTYKVTLKKGLTSYYREIKEDIHYTLKTSDRSKAILFDKKKPYISNHGELSFSSVNIDKATLIVERILDDNLRYFMNFNSANKEAVNSYTKEIFTKELTLNQKKNIVLKQKFKLSDLSRNRLPVGIYKITLRFEEQVGEEKKERASSKVLFLSDLGISANIGITEALITILSLETAKPIKNAQVQIYGKNNALLGTATTNNSGIAIIKNQKLLTSHPQGVIVQHASDKNFLALNTNIDSPSIDEILKKAERFKSNIYFQSNIVRPKTKIHALLTVKDRDFISASKIPVKVIFKELYGKVLHEKVYHTDQYGLIDFSYQLDNNDKTGNYSLSVYLGDKQIGFKKLKVEAFLPPKIENSIKTNKDIYQTDELIELNISSSYLFGSPSAGLQGKVTLNARPISYVNKKYKNYNFTNNLLAQKNVTSYIDSSEDIVLDENGKFEMVIKNRLTQKVPSILEAMIGVTIMDDAQPVSNYKKVKIYPYKAMVGVKIDTDSFEKGQKLEGRAILIDPRTGKEIKRELYAVIKRVEWHYDYRSGNYHWEKETTVVDSFTINSNETFSREVLENGDHIIEVFDHLGGHSASQSFDVWWWNYSNISPSSDLKSVEIKFEDKLYKKGDVIKIQIKSPILEGQLLLSLEGKSLDNYKLIQIHKGVAKTSLKIRHEMKRGLHLHATAFRASNSDSKLIPFRAMGYKFVKPNRNAHKIKIELQVPKVSKSKTSLAISVKTSKPSKVLISIVDRGILQLVNQKEPKIFDYFNQEPPKYMSYYDLYDQLLAYIAEGTLVDFGAGDMLSKKQKHLAPDLGKRIKPFMIWSGVVESHEGVAKIDIEIPEFNGRASVVAIAINKDSIGVESQDIVIKDDIMIKPSYPRYTLNGDKIEVPIRIFNTTKTEKIVELSSTTSNNLNLEINEKLLTIPANSSKRIVANLQPHKIGKGEITLLAKYDQTSVRKNVELPILSPYALSTKTFKGISNTLKSFKVPAEYKDAKVFITLSNNLIGVLRDDLKYLIHYPYGCAEQTSSKLSAMYFSKAFLNKDKLVKRSEYFILQGVKKLHNMQNYWGEFNYWEGEHHVNAYASLYAAQTLLDIQRGAGPVKENFKKKIIKILNSVASANGDYEGSYTNFHRLFAAYILAENKALPDSIANMLYEKKLYKGHFLATFYMAAILKTEGKIQKADKLFADNSYELSRYAYKTYGNRTGNFESNVRDMMLHFIIKTKYFNKNSKDLIAIQKEFTNLYSTQSKAIALKAISTYLGQPKNSKMDVTVKINGKSRNYKKPKIISVDKVSSNSITLVPNGVAMSYSIELVKNLPKKLKNKLSSKKELSIKREFIDENGNKVDIKNLKQGEKFFSKVTVVNYGKIEHVVINQRIPACITIVNNNIKDQESHFKDENINQEHKEIRDDRILHFINLRKKEEWSNSLRKYLLKENRGVLYSPLMATSIGECKLPAIITESMYDTRINDYAKTTNSIIVKKLTNPKIDTKKHIIVKIETKKEVKKTTLADKAESLVKEIYTREMNSNNPLEFANFFEYPLSIYFRTKDFKKEELIKDKRKYFKDWSKRIYTNMKTNVVSYDKKRKEVKVKISFTYKIYNGKKVLTGVSNHLLTILKKDKKLMVTAVELWKKK